MADEVSDESGGKESMDNSVEINEVPAETEERERKEVPEGFPEGHSGQNQHKNIARHGPVKEYLTGVILSG